MSTLSGGPNIVTNGLVLYLDAANPRSYVSGSTAWNDLSTFGNNGTLVSGINYSSTNGGTLVFDGTTKTATLLDANSLDIADNITISFWFNVFAYTSAVYSVNFFSKFPNTTTANYMFYFDGTFTPRKLLVYANRGGVWSTVSPTTADIPLSSWTHITWTYNSVTGGFLYVNGNRLSTVGVGSGVLATNSQNILIGNTLNGSIASSQIYNRVLTADEVLQNYNATKTRFGL
jgi:hypothetical protein